MSQATGQDKINSFWDWFKLNNSKYLFLNDISEDEKERLMDELLVQLHNYCDGLYFEIGGHPSDSDVELIITAQGVKENFEKVETLVDLAPQIENWVFLKFKQPHGPGFIAEFEGIKFDPEKIIYFPLDNKSQPELIGISVCYSELNDDNRDMYTYATYILLDTLLGEKAAVCDLDFVNLITTPSNIADYNFGHLSDIGEYIKQRKGTGR